MASLLPESLFEIYGQCPAPSKDFYHLHVTKSDVTWRWWKISLRNNCRNAKPGAVKHTHQHFLDDTRLQSQVRLVFGPVVLRYALGLCQGHYDFLCRLPDQLLLHILAHLELEDVGRLGCTSRRFRKLCSSEAFWQQAVRGACGGASAELCSLALEVGWRSVFFTNKLQLQKMLRRHRLRMQREAECGDTELDPSTLHSHSQPPGGSISEESSDVEADPSSSHRPEDVLNPELVPVGQQPCGDMKPWVVTVAGQDVANGGSEDRWD